MNDYFGKSGSNLKLNIKDNLYFVKKTSKYKRFENQIIKQLDFKENLFFSKPKIYSFEKTNEEYICDMEYINGIDPIIYLGNCSNKELDLFAEKIIYFINNQIELSSYQSLDIKIFIEKIESINIDFYLKNKIKKYINNFYFNKSFLLPVGKCHGDFTISNMLFSNKIYLIDFLDSFYESPLQDIVKIKQDTNYHWITKIYKSKEDIDLLKVKINLNYIDKKISIYFENFFWYKDLYKIFQIFNLIRILPYLKNEDKEINNFLIKNIEKLMLE
jgi:hypothetical protein